MNKVILIGRLTKDPELRFIPSSGTAVARFTMAVNREYSKEKEADFFNIVVWGKIAEACAQYTKKGRLIAVEGSMRNNNYEDKNGVKHYNIEINASKVEFLEWSNKSRDELSTQSTEQSTEQQNDLTGFKQIDGDDDIPF